MVTNMNLVILIDNTMNLITKVTFVSQENALH